MFKYYSLIILFFTSSAVVFAQEIEELIGVCAQIAAGAERLSCYDDVAENNNSNVRQNYDSSETGEWYIETSVNPFDDSKVVYLLVQSSAGVSDYGEPFSFWIRCESNETDVWIDWDEYVGDEMAVTTRIDKEQARTILWEASTDGEASFHPQPIPFIKSLFDKSQLVAQVIPYLSDPYTAIFDISYLDNVIQPVRETCNW